MDVLPSSQCDLLSRRQLVTHCRILCGGGDGEGEGVGSVGVSGGERGEAGAVGFEGVEF